MPMRLGVLAILDVADMDRGHLATALDEWTGEAWAFDPGEMDATLAQLEREGLVEVIARFVGEACRDHTTYAITGTGRDALGDWFAADADDQVTPPRQELLAKILLSLPAGRERALAVVVQQRHALTIALQTRRRALRAAGSVEPDGRGLRALSPVLVEDARVSQVEAELRWLDLCEARLQRVRLDQGGAA